MKKTLAKIWPESKKARALLLGLIMLGLGPLAVKLGMNVETVTKMVGAGMTIIGVYIHGQGKADQGKEAEKVKAQAEAWKADDGPKPNWL